MGRGGRGKSGGTSGLHHNRFATTVMQLTLDEKNRMIRSAPFSARNLILQPRTFVRPLSEDESMCRADKKFCPAQERL